MSLYKILLNSVNKLPYHEKQLKLLEKGKWMTKENKIIDLDKLNSTYLERIAYSALKKGIITSETEVNRIIKFRRL